jgi:hypothetical protein
MLLTNIPAKQFSLAVVLGWLSLHEADARCAPEFVLLYC